MKNIFMVIVLALACCNGTIEKVTAQTAATASYTKGDLKKIGWIEGKWKGLYNGESFYEMYRFVNDSTLESLSYEWNGKDSSKTSRSYLHFKDGFYWLGDKQNYKVISISENEIKMLPNVEAYNEILWKYRDGTGWDAVLKGKKTTNIYNMQHFDPFKK